MKVECTQQNITIGIVVIAISLLFIFVLSPLGIEIPPHSADADTAVPPDFFPDMICWFAVICGALLIVSSILNLRAGRGVVVPSQTHSIDKQACIVRGVAMLALIAYYWLAEWFGIILVGLLYYVIFAYCTGERRPVRALVGAFITVGVLYYFFVHIASVALPMGILQDFLI